MEISLLSAINEGWLACTDAAIAVPPAADDVKVFQGESGRIDFDVAARTLRALAMLGQLIADCRGAANVGFNGLDIAGRLRRGCSQNAVEHPRPAENR